MKKEILIVLAVIFLASLVVTVGLIISSQRINFTGSITAVGVGVYKDAACTINETGIQVGNINPGSSNTYTVYIKNTGNSNITLSMLTSDWIPAYASTILTLTWNAPSTLQPNQVATVNLILTAIQNTGSLTTFSFSATITGTQL